MSFWTALAKVLPVEFTTVSADVEAAVKAVQAKADADIAALRKNAAVKAAVLSVDQRMAAFKTAVSDYEAKLAAEKAAAQATPAPAATGTTGPTGGKA